MVELWAAEGSSVSEATTETNNTGEFDTVVSFTPDEGRAFVIQNNGPKGTAPGVPIYSKMQDSSANDLPTDTEVAIAYLRNGERVAQIISEEMTNISVYNNVTIANQRDTENVDSTKHDMDGGSLEVRDVDEVHIQIKSSTAIDHANSQFYIDGSYVSETEMGR